MEDTTASPPATSTDTTTDAGIDVADWSPETIEAETGVVLDGDGLPVNHRLRAERLARDGKATDATGAIDDDLIADASARLDAIAAAYPAVRVNMRTDDLTKIAEAESVDLSSASTNSDRVDLINSSRTSAGIITGDLS